jgi:kynurenine formamidase
MKQVTPLRPTVAALVTVALTGAMAGGGDATRLTAAAGQASTASRDVSQAQLDRWKKELSNWGRWGKDDQLGTMNLVTAEKRKQAATLVKEGFPVSLSVDADTVKSIDNPRPYDHQMQGIGSDRVGVAYHGWSHTHLDSLAHHHDGGVFFNGYKPDEAQVLTSGHTKNSIHNLKTGVFTRGILIDVPRLKKLPYLEPGTPVFVEDLEAFEKMAGVKAGPGDVLLIRTGVWAYRQKFGAWERGRNGKVAGPHPSMLPWLKERGIAILATDGQAQVAPSNLPGAVHDISMSVLGIHVLDNADFEALGEAAAARTRWEFLFIAAPLAIKGGTGSPLNPIAMF